MKIYTQRAFTLVELLVVVAIIALLLSILLPALSQARKVAEGVACMSRMKQMGLSSSLYANDFNDFSVPMGYKNKKTRQRVYPWWYQIDSLGGYVDRDPAQMVDTYMKSDVFR